MAIYTTTIEIGEDGHEVEIRIDYTWHRAIRGARDGKFGAPIEPDEPAHAEINSVQIVDDNHDHYGVDKTIELSKDQEEFILLEIARYIEEQHYAAMESAAEARRDAEMER